ncbi:ABC transporter ATP-binding protein [Paenibacillus koleovorans]|uniref:ABC transporter ATP-binding protein n=1 Tax=Paenibacillus koleovorans TaxID=121608 RepID=UPI000FD795C6|nr:ABC transporter ATP-binding protein [Paenibacillus koleovorans]
MERDSSSQKPTKAWSTYRWIVSHLRPYKYKMAVIIACGLAIAAGELVVPQLIGQLIDDIIPDRDRAAFIRLLLLMAGVYSVVLALGIVHSWLQTIVGVSASRDIQAKAIKHLRKLGFAHYERSPVGETLSLMNQQVQAAEQVVRRFFPSIVQTSLFLVAAGAVLLSRSITLTLLIVPFALFYYTFGPRIDRNVAKATKIAVDARTVYNKKIYESVAGAREFRAIGAEEWDIERVRSIFRRVTTTVLRWVFLIHLRWSIRSVLFQLGSVAMFVAGYLMVRSGGITVGDFITFLLLYSVFMGRLTSLVTMLIEQNTSLHQSEPLRQLLLLTPEVEESPQPIQLGTIRGELTLHNVRFAYPGRPPLLEGISLSIRAGERVALVGKSGNGKSTLLKLLNRFYDPTDGLIRLDGIPLNRLSFDELRGAVGFVFQDTYLFGKSIRDNIRFGNPDASEEAIVEAAKAADAHGFISELADGYDTIVGERGIKLSGGQKQRLALARMLIRDPQIVLLDEATSALDPISENSVREALARLLHGRTTVTVAHRLSTVKDYDKIAVLDQGRIAEMGTYEELMAQQGLFHTLVLGENERERESATESDNKDAMQRIGGDAVVLR